VVNQDIAVNWLENGEFWYREDRWRQSPLFWKVNPYEATRALLFDSEQLSSSLPGDQVDWSQFRLLKLEPELSFLYQGEGYTIGDNGEARSADLAVQSRIEPLTTYASSTAGGASVNVRIENVSDLVIEIHWYDFEGESVPYAKLEPGQSWEQSSYAGHVWLILHEDAVLAAYRTPDRPATATFSGDEPTPVLESASNASGQPRYSVRFTEGAWQVAAGSETSTFEVPAGRNGLGWSASWSRDRTKVAVLEEQPVTTRQVTLIESRPSEEVHPRLRSFPYRRPGDAIPYRQPVLLDLNTGERHAAELPELEGAFAVDQLRFGPDGRLLFRINERGHQRVATYAWRPGQDPWLVVEDVSETFVDYSQKSWYQDLSSENALLKMTERTGWNHLERVDLNTGQRSLITEGEWLVREVLEVDEESRSLLIRVFGYYPDQDPYHSHFARVSFDGSSFRILTESDGEHRLDWSPNGDFFVATYSRVDLPPRYELRTDEGELVMELGQADATGYLEAGRRFPERWVAKGRDGQTDIWGVLWRPTDFDPEKSYAIVEDIYAGPHGHFTPKDFREFHGAQRIADLGFIVVKMDGMGTNWRSKAFHDVAWKNLADAGFPDRKRWIKALAAEYPQIDADRVGIFGVSAGGQSAMRALIDHHDLYDVAVADCGCHDNRVDKIWWNEAWMGYPVDEAFSSSSNVDQAHRMEGDLLLLVGELDSNVPPASTLQVVDALIKADKKFDFLMVPGAGHGTIGIPYVQRKFWRFLYDHLGGPKPLVN
jgi:dipeptidyl aminopeptidase/acylaminoacyl peptidase